MSKYALIVAYLVVWAFSLIVFWFFTRGSDAMGYGIVFLWVLLPLATLIISFFIGKNNYGGKGKWLFALVLGVMYMLAEYATFSAANMVSFSKINLPDFGMIPAGALISLAGMIIGVGARHLKQKPPQHKR